MSIEIAKLQQLLNKSSIKSLQTGFVNTAASSGTGEDVKFVDITINNVDINKCIIFFDGGCGGTDKQAFYKSGSTESYLCTTRLTNNTNLRIATIVTYSSNVIAGRWSVIEFN